MKRLESGGREKVHEDAVKQMLGLRIEPSTGSIVNDQQVKEGNGEHDESGDSDDDDDDDDDDGEGYMDKKGDRYHRILPARTDPEARQAEKDARKEARKQAKLAAAEKRKHKIPKHIKKSAVKKGSKNKKWRRTYLE